MPYASACSSAGSECCAIAVPGPASAVLLLFLLFLPAFVFFPSAVLAVCVPRINYAFIYTTIFVLLAVQFSLAVDAQNEQVE